MVTSAFLHCNVARFDLLIILNKMGRPRRERSKGGKEEDGGGRLLDLWEARTIFKVLFKVRDVYDIWNFPTGFIPTSIRARTMMTMIRRSLVPVADGFSGATSLYFPGVLSINRKYVYVSDIQLTITRSLNHTDGSSLTSDRLLLLVEINIWRSALISRHFIVSVAIKLNHDQQFSHWLISPEEMCSMCI